MRTTLDRVTGDICEDVVHIDYQQEEALAGLRLLDASFVAGAGPHHHVRPAGDLLGPPPQVHTGHRLDLILGVQGPQTVVRHQGRPRDMPVQVVREL